MPKFVVGSLASDHVIVRVLGREREATDYWDGNWLITPITINAGRFRGEVPADLRSEELRRFRSELQEVHSSLSGEAVLASLDGWISLVVKCEWNGSLTVTRTANDRPGTGSELEFKIEGMDQSHLPELIAPLLAVEAAFPVIGSPL
ncbi:MAG: hypothetical protein QOD92_1845 [Acidimicrobiaceae bacterium]